MKFRPIMIIILLFSLFVISFINFGILLTTSNNVNSSILFDSDIRGFANDINETLITVYADANDTETSFTNSPVTLTSSSGGVIIDAISGVWKTIKRAPVVLYNLLADLIFSKIFGDNSYAIIIVVISSIVIFTIILAVWKLIRQGDAG
jgi:hypothetical protein